MTETDEITTFVNETLTKLNGTTVSKLQEWGKLVQLTIDEDNFFIDFSDKEHFFLRVGSKEDYDFKLSTSSATFFQIIRNELNPVEAVVSGEVTIEGSLTDALEFSELITTI